MFLFVGFLPFSKVDNKTPKRSNSRSIHKVFVHSMYLYALLVYQQYIAYTETFGYFQDNRSCASVFNPSIASNIV